MILSCSSFRYATSLLLYYYCCCYHSKQDKQITVNDCAEKRERKATEFFLKKKAKCIAAKQNEYMKFQITTV